MAEEEAGRETHWRQRETAVAPGNSSIKPEAFMSGFGSHLPHGGPSQRLSHAGGNEGHLKEPGKVSHHKTSQQGSIFRLTEPRGRGCTALLPTPDDTVGDLLVEMEGDLDVWKGFEKRLSTLKDERKSVTTQEQVSAQDQVEHYQTLPAQPLGTASVITQARATTRFSGGSQRRPVPEKAIRIIQDQLKSTQESIEVGSIKRIPEHGLSQSKCFYKAQLLLDSNSVHECCIATLTLVSQKVKAIFRRGEDGATYADTLHIMENGPHGTLSLPSHRSQYWPFLTQPGGLEDPPPLIKNLPQDSESSCDSREPPISTVSLVESVPSLDRHRPSTAMKRRKHEDQVSPSPTSDADCCRTAKRARYDTKQEITQAHEDIACVKKLTLWERVIKPNALKLSSQTSANHPVVSGRRFLSRKLLRPFSFTGFFGGVAAQVFGRLRGRCDESSTQCVAWPQSKDAESAGEILVTEGSNGTTATVVIESLTESKSSSLVISEEGTISDETAVPLSESLAEDDPPAVSLEVMNSGAAIHRVVKMGELVDDTGSPVKFIETRGEAVRHEEQEAAQEGQEKEEQEEKEQEAQEEEEMGYMEAEALSSSETEHSSADPVLEIEFPRGELTVESDSVDPVASTTEEEVESVQEEDVVQLSSTVLLETPESAPASSSTSSTVPSARLLVVIDDEDAAVGETAAAIKTHGC